MRDHYVRGYCLQKSVAVVAAAIVIGVVCLPALADGIAFAPVWKDLGPGQILSNPVNTAVNVEGMDSYNNPTTGAITKVLVDPSDPNIIYAGAVNGGIWKSTDSGKDWTPKTDRLSSLSIGAMNFDSLDTTNQTLIAGTGKQSAYGFISGPLTGIQYSTNGGTTWSELGRTDLIGKDITGVAARGSVMLAAVRNIDNPITDFGLYLSNDGGKIFSNKVVEGLPAGNVQNLVADPSDPKRFYLSVVNGNNNQTGIYRSDNTGASWELVKAVSGLSTKDSDGRILLSVGAEATKGAGGVLVAQIQQCQSPCDQTKNLLTLLRTADQGKTWADLGKPVTPPPGFTGLFPGGQTKLHGAVLVDPKNSNIIYVAGDTQFSTNEMKTANSIGATQWSIPIFRGEYNPVTEKTTWAWITNNKTSSGSAPHADARTFAIDANGRLLFGGDGGLNALPSPASSTTSDWIPIMGNLRTTEMTQSSWNSITHSVSASAQDVGAYYQFPGQKGSFNWSSTMGGDGGPSAVNAETLKLEGISSVYASAQYLGDFSRFQVSKTDNPQQAATTLTRVHPLLGNVDISGDERGKYMSFLPLIALNRTDPRKMAIGGKQLFIGTDNLTVNALDGYSFPVTSILTPVNEITSLAYGSKDKAGALLAGAGDFWSATKTGNFYYTPDAGNVTMTTLNSYTGKKVWSAIFDERVGSRFYVADGTDVWRSTDTGSSFAKINDALPGSFVDRRALAFADNNGVNALFVGGVSNVANGSGVYVSRFTSDPSVDTVATPSWSSFGGSMANAPVFGLSYNATDDVLLVNQLGRGAWAVYDMTSYFPEATKLIFGKADNDSAPTATLLTDGTPVGGGEPFSRALLKTGSGTLTISGAASYTGGTTIDGGILRADNSHALGTGAVINNATLDIGSTTLNIGGAYTQGSAAMLKVAINGSSSGSIETKGSATVIQGDSVALSVSNYIPNNTTYKIINGTAGTGIATPSISITGNNKATFAATTIGEDLILTSNRAANGFASNANPGDANARAVGNVLDNITNPSTDMSNVLNTLEGLSQSQTAAALNTLVPEVDAGVINNDRAMLNNFTGVSIDRVEKAHIEGQSKHSKRSGVSSGEANKLDGLWAKGYGSYLTQGMRGGIAGYNAWNAGTALGVDHRFTDAVTLGISGGYAYGNVNSDANGANTTINSAQTTLYGGYQDQKRPFFIDTAVSFAYNWYAGRRNINVGDVILRTANGSYDGQQYGAYLGGGYQFKFADGIEVTPLVSLQYNNLHINSYGETGAGALNLNAGTQNYNQLQSGLGGRIATTLSS
ncbi:MAG: autotransporter domain-containing protein, partial [bacterium]